MNRARIIKRAYYSSILRIVVINLKGPLLILNQLNNLKNEN